jgi:predicted membrane-bound spermidine synthase
MANQTYKRFSLKAVKSHWHDYNLLIVSLVNGAVIMVFELIGSRIIAPHLGSSSFVWTSIIGVILMALSVGYFYGGILADKGASRRKLSIILLIAAGLILASRFVRDDLLVVISDLSIDMRLKSFIASILLFGPASVLMGMVSPYVARLQLNNLSHAGATVGSLYAAGTVGSIIGTFLYGYWLVGHFSNGTVHAALAIIMVLLSFAVSAGSLGRTVHTGGIAIIILSFIAAGIVTAGPAIELDTDTQYARVIVSKTTLDNRPARIYFTEAKRAQSGIFLDGEKESAFGYVQKISEYIEASEYKNVLMIGGGTFTLASDIVRHDPEMHIDVVEIDPALTHIARQYFNFQDSPRITIHNGDGREFLESNQQKKYDVIIIDAYTVNGPPFQLATTEAAEKMKALLEPGGVVITNSISSFDGANSRILSAVSSTYKEHFSHVSSMPVFPTTHPSTLQNILLFASDDKKALPDDTVAFAPQTSIPPLTDDFAPVEYYTAQAYD